jgi:hypothetical protein
MIRRTRFTLFLFLLLLGAFCAGCATTEQSTLEVPIYEKSGPVTGPERALLAGLKEQGIPLPDSVVIVKDTVAHGYVDHWGAPGTVHLTTARRGSDVKIASDFPYLFGRTGRPPEEVRLAHVIAHETAHVHGPYLNAEMGRPALGVSTKTSEVQAEILALVYLDLVMGLGRSELGYPAKVEYPFVPDKSVRALKRQYCFIVKKTWSVEGLRCGAVREGR